MSKLSGNKSPSPSGHICAFSKIDPDPSTIDIDRKRKCKEVLIESVSRKNSKTLSQVNRYNYKQLDPDNKDGIDFKCYETLDLENWGYKKPVESDYIKDYKKETIYKDFGTIAHEMGVDISDLY
jgi:hypothetical protein